MGSHLMIVVLVFLSCTGCKQYVSSRAVYNPHLLLRRGLMDQFEVCELPLYETCNGNNSRTECTLRGCCFFMNACYKKKVPGYISTFCIIILIFMVLFLGLLGFGYYKYRSLNSKQPDASVKEECTGGSGIEMEKNPPHD